MAKESYWFIHHSEKLTEKRIDEFITVLQDTLWDSRNPDQQATFYIVRTNQLCEHCIAEQTGSYLLSPDPDSGFDLDDKRFEDTDLE